MDTGIMLNMLKGTAAANTPAVNASYSVTTQGMSENANANSPNFPALLANINAQNSTITTASAQEGKPVTSVEGAFQTLTMNVKDSGVMRPEGAPNILAQGVVILDSAAVEKIVAQNKALAGKLDSLIAAGDIEGFAAIMQNIKAIVEQINAGEFDISNLEGMLAQANGSAAILGNGSAPTVEHNLSSMQAAARFQPIMQVGTSPNSEGQLLPTDILIELADLGQSPLSGTTVSPNGQAGVTPAALAMTGTSEQAMGGMVAPLVAAATLNATQQMTPTSTPKAQATTATPTQPAIVAQNTSEITPQAADIVVDRVTSNVTGMTAQELAQETAQANKVEHSPVAGVTLDKESVGLTVAALAATKLAGTPATPAAPLTEQANQVTAQGALLPQQAAVQATVKSQAQPATQAQTQQSAQAGQAPIETGNNANSGNSGNGQSSNNTPSEGHSHPNTAGHGQQQSMQDKPSHQQLEMKAEAKVAAHSPTLSALPTHQTVPMAASTPEPTAMASKNIVPDFINTLAANPGDIRPMQGAIAPKVFGGTLSKGLAKNVAEQVGMEVTRAAKEGNTEFTVRLNPVELGKVTIKMAFDKDGTTSLKVLAQSPETLALLQRDQRGLERAIEAGGLKSSQSEISIELDTQHDGQSAGKAFTEAAREEMAQDNRDKFTALKAGDVADTPQAEDITPLEQILAQLDNASGLDIRV